MSEVIIVDEKDNIISYKERKSISQKDIYRVSALWIMNSKGDSLLAQRSFNKKMILESGVQLLRVQTKKEKHIYQI